MKYALNLLVFIFSSIDDIEDNSLLRRGIPGKQTLLYTEYSELIFARCFTKSFYIKDTLNTNVT